MKRQQNTESSTRVYSYGCVPARVSPVRNEESALAQLRLGRRLWNTIVSIEHVRDERYRKIMFDENQRRADTLGEEMAALRDQIKAARKSVRARKADLGDLPDRLAAVKAERSGIIAKLKASSKERHLERKSQLEANVATAYTRVKRARQAAARMGLFWGSYNDIVQRADAGRKLGDLHFRGFRGEGTVTAQIMGGASVGSCVGGGHTFFQVDGPREGEKWRYARMRIGSNPDRSPVWLEIPIVYHREIPTEANIKSVSATRRIIAGKVRWQLNVTVSVPAVMPKTGSRAVALDIGWRLLPEGLRVAYWHDGEAHGQIVVPKLDVDQFKKIDSLRSICDQSREESVPMLAAWLNGKALNEEWLKRSAHLIQWKSSDRVAALIRWWADNRIEGDGEIFEAASAWRKQYLHLANWWRNLSEQMTLRVREQYRIFAKRIAGEYDTVVLEDFDLREVAKIPEPESEESYRNSYRRIASPSTCRAALKNACSREGVATAVLPAEYTTRTCHACGDNHEWNQEASVIHRCDACGAIWDQDFNAALNLLRLWRARGGSANTAAA